MTDLCDGASMMQQNAGMRLAEIVMVRLSVAEAVVEAWQQGREFTILRWGGSHLRPVALGVIPGKERNGARPIQN
jgi:hypothetical protein